MGPIEGLPVYLATNLDANWAYLQRPRHEAAARQLSVYRQLFA